MVWCYFQVDGTSIGWEGHHLNLPKDDLKVKYFVALDMIWLLYTLDLINLVF